MNSTSSQIRQDFSYFGGFGQHGYGYNVKFLYTSIGNILGINDYYSAIILGAGHLGIVLAGNSIFTKRGVILRGIFDADPDVIGTAVSSGLTVGGIKTVFDFCEQTKVNIIVLTKYTEYAHKLIAASGSNIRGIWNFTGEKLDVPPEIAVQDVCFSDTLMTLCYYIKTVEEGQSNGGNEAQIPD
jgi:redox-sensing transcriptional repressor